MIDNLDLNTGTAIKKKIDDNVSSSEYILGKNRFINIAVNQSSQELNLFYKTFSDHLIKNNYKIVSQFLTGNPNYEIENKISAKKFFKDFDWPVTSIKQDGNNWGTLLTAIKSDNVIPIFQDNNTIGNYYSDEYSDYCVLGGLLPSSITSSRSSSTSSVFDLIERSLEKSKMNFNNIVRTWFYLDNLLEWYKEFNTVRTEHFIQKCVFDNLVPASTGIGVSNIRDKHLIAAVYGVKPKNEMVKINAVSSPLQCSAINYKSSFSRAVEIDHPDYRHLIISGTASIDSNGNTINIGNIDEQIKHTMSVVREILYSREMNWNNVIRGIVYFKNLNDIEIFNNYCSINKINHFPLVMIQADICRHELLFEIELEALSIKMNK